MKSLKKEELLKKILNEINFKHYPYILVIYMDKSGVTDKKFNKIKEELRYLDDER